MATPAVIEPTRTTDTKAMKRTTIGLGLTMLLALSACSSSNFDRSDIGSDPDAGSDDDGGFGAAAGSGGSAGSSVTGSTGGTSTTGGAPGAGAGGQPGAGGSAGEQMVGGSGGQLGEGGSGGLGGVGTAGAAGAGTGGVAGAAGAGTGGTQNTAGTGGSAGAPNPCEAVADGTSCGIDPEDICLDESCVVSECGDGFVDDQAQEQCDDGQNGDDDDGCTDDCRYSCEDDNDCSDGAACNGVETCDGFSHTCEAGAPVNCDDGNPCTVDSCAPNGSCNHEARDDGASCGSNRICLGAVCRQSVCGDQFVDTARGEDCDDGKDGDDHDGCRDDCSWTCTSAADCSDNDVCNGSETCDLATHTCELGSMLDCNDNEVCTEDTCDPTGGCQNDFIDADNDGFSPIASCSGASFSGGDCNDDNANVFPGQSQFYSVPIQGSSSFDYDCDLALTKWDTRSAGSCTSTGSCKSGWISAVPGCGVAATFRSCSLLVGQGCVKSETTREQACR